MNNRLVKSSLEAEVDIIVPNDESNHPLVDLLRREGIDPVVHILSPIRLSFTLEHILKTLFITSDVSILDEGSLGSGAESLEWVYTESFEIGDDLGMVSFLLPDYSGYCAYFVLGWVL